jgi:transposase
VVENVFRRIFWITILANPTVLPQLLRFRDVELVNPKNTSQIYSGCGQLVKKEFSERTHSCPFCGLVLDRDHNAAINLSLELQSVRKTDRCLSL